MSINVSRSAESDCSHNLPAEEGTRPAVHNVLDPEEALLNRLSA